MNLSVEIESVGEQTLSSELSPPKKVLRAAKHISGCFAPQKLINEPLEPHRAELENEPKNSAFGHDLPEQELFG